MGAKRSDGTAVFAVASFAVLFGLLGLVVYLAYTSTQDFEAECAILNGEVARMKGAMICIDPDTILLRKHSEHDHKH